MKFRGAGVANALGRFFQPWQRSSSPTSGSRLRDADHDLSPSSTRAEKQLRTSSPPVSSPVPRPPIGGHHNNMSGLSRQLLMMPHDESTPLSDADTVKDCEDEDDADGESQPQGQPSDADEVEQDVAGQTNEGPGFEVIDELLSDDLSGDSSEADESDDAEPTNGGGEVIYILDDTTTEETDNNAGSDNGEAECHEQGQPDDSAAAEPTNGGGETIYILDDTTTEETDNNAGSDNGEAESHEQGQPDDSAAAEPTNGGGETIYILDDTTTEETDNNAGSDNGEAESHEQGHHQQPDDSAAAEPTNGGGETIYILDDTTTEETDNNAGSDNGEAESHEQGQPDDSAAAEPTNGGGETIYILDDTTTEETDNNAGGSDNGEVKSHEQTQAGKLATTPKPDTPPQTAQAPAPTSTDDSFPSGILLQGSVSHHYKVTVEEMYGRMRRVAKTVGKDLPPLITIKQANARLKMTGGGGVQVIWLGTAPYCLHDQLITSASVLMHIFCFLVVLSCVIRAGSKNDVKLSQTYRNAAMQHRGIGLDAWLTQQNLPAGWSAVLKQETWPDGTALPDLPMGSQAPPASGSSTRAVPASGSGSASARAARPLPPQQQGRRPAKRALRGEGPWLAWAATHESARTMGQGRFREYTMCKICASQADKGTDIFLQRYRRRCHSLSFFENFLHYQR